MCHVFFLPSRAVISVILRDEYLTLAVRTKEGDKAGSNQPPARDPVQFTLKLTPNYLIGHFTVVYGSETEGDLVLIQTFLLYYVNQVILMLTIIFHQSAYRDQTNIPVRGRVVVLNCQRLLYADWWIWIDTHTSNAFDWDFCTGHVEKAGLATSGSLFSRNFGRIELSFRWGMDTYHSSGSGVGIFEVRN